MQDVKITDQVARHENAGHKNAGHKIAGHENAGKTFYPLRFPWSVIFMPCYWVRHFMSCVFSRPAKSKMHRNLTFVGYCTECKLLCPAAPVERGICNLPNFFVMYVVQVLSGLLPVREPDLRPADATEDAQLASKVPLLSLDAVRCWHYPELCPIDHRRVVLRPCCIRHRCFHLQVHRVQRVGILLHERLKFEYRILIEQLN